MSRLILPGRFNEQSQQILEIDWANPVTNGLSFAAVPYGLTYFDCVSRVAGTLVGGIATTALPNNGGKTTVNAARGLIGTTASVSQVIWPVSLNRGAGMVQNATVLALASMPNQVDGNVYVIGGNTESVTDGSGFSLGVDSFKRIARGNVVISSYWEGSAGETSPSQLLGNPFNNKLHFFGFAATGNGANATWFGGGVSESGATGGTKGTTTTNRRANIFSRQDSNGTTDASVALLMFWDRAISVAEYLQLYVNPWQIFKAPQRRVFVASSGNQTLTPSLFTNTNTFYSPTVTAGAVNLTPSLFTNTNTFYNPTVLSTYPLTPSLFTNSNTFYSHTVAAGAVDLTPSLFTNTNTFYSPTVTGGSIDLQPSLFTNTNTFYSPTVTATYALTPSLFTNSNTFYSPTVTTTYALTPSLFTNTNTFYSPTVALASGDQTLTPSLFTNSNTFYTHVVTNGLGGFTQAQLDFLVIYMTANLPNQLKRWNGSAWV